MATQVQFRGGSTSDHSNFNGVSREVTVDTEKRTVVVQDGVKDGGYPAMSSIGSTTIKSQDTDASKTRETRYFLEAIPAQGAQMSLYDADETQKVRISADSSADTFFLNTKVGIGTSSPAHELHVSSGAQPTFRLSGNTNTFEIKADTSTTAIRNTTGTNLEFGTSNTGRFNIDTAGTFNQVNGAFSVTSGGFTSMLGDLRVGATSAFAGTPLEVEVTGSTAGAVGMSLINGQSSNENATCVLRSYQQNRVGGDIVFGRENSDNWNDTPNYADGFISFNPVLNGSAVERVRIASDGDVVYTGLTHDYNHASGAVVNVVVPNEEYKDYTHRSKNFILQTGSGSASERMRIDYLGYTSFEGQVIAGNSNSESFGLKANASSGASDMKAAVYARNHSSGGRNWVGMAYNGTAEAGVTSSITEAGVAKFNGGIDFSGAQSEAGGMTSETLDAYEEGTWTPVPYFAASSAAATCTTVGYYTKIGRLVQLTYSLVFNGSHAGATGNSFTMQGLPFSVNATYYNGCGFSYLHRLAALQTKGQMHIGLGGTTANFKWPGYDGNDNADVLYEDIGTTTNIWGSISYFTS